MRTPLTAALALAAMASPASAIDFGNCIEKHQEAMAAVKARAPGNETDVLRKKADADLVTCRTKVTEQNKPQIGRR